LHSLAKQVGFKVLTSTNFKEVYESAKPNSSHHKLLLQMNKGQDLPLTSEELELAGECLSRWEVGLFC